MPQYIHLNACPLCGSESRIEKALLASDHTVSRRHFEIWQCSNCTLRFTQDFPLQEEIADYYRSEDYISHTETRKGLINQAYHLVRQWTLRMKSRWVQTDSGIIQGNILDIGCGTGAFLETMRKQGWQVTGLEPDEGAREKARMRYRLEILPAADLEKLQGQVFDVITLWHVLEHVHDLHGTLRHIKRVMKKKGTVFIAVPNYTSPDAGIYRENWAAYDVPRHLYHFTPAAMQYLAGMHGWEIQSIHPMVFDAFYVSLLSEKHRGNPFGLIKGCWNGMRSWSASLADKSKSSSLVYTLNNKLKDPQPS